MDHQPNIFRKSWYIKFFKGQAEHVTSVLLSPDFIFNKILIQFIYYNIKPKMFYQAQLLLTYYYFFSYWYRYFNYMH